MSDLVQRVEDGLRRRDLLPRGAKILVAVSGGADSMVLLQVLHILATKYHWRLCVAHFNHHLRGRASDADERLVRATAARLGWECVTGGADVKASAARWKFSVEMAARRLRHAFFAETARARKIKFVALAHHADDQVELFFLRLLRGSGSEALGGMKWQSPSPADRAVTLVRPLLECSKAELLAGAREMKIAFREDATNRATDFLRNRIRRELLPLLRREYQPGIDAVILRLMDLVVADGEVVTSAAQAHLIRLKRGARTRSARRFAELPLGVQRRVLHLQLTEVGLLPDFELVERLRLWAGAEVSAGTGLFVSRNAEGKLHCREHLAADFDPAAWHVDVSASGGEAHFAGLGVRWERKRLRQFRLPAKKGGGAAGARQESFDAERVGDEIVLRHWQPGDRFQPIGMTSAVKLQDLFVNAKIPASRRRELVLAVTKSGEIFWVDGLRIGERFKITSATRRILEWRWAPESK